MGTFLWRGRPVEFMTGETLAAALVRAGVRDFATPDNVPSGGRFFCGIGACQGCLARDDGGPAFETCLTPATADMRLWPVILTTDWINSRA